MFSTILQEWNQYHRQTMSRGMRWLELATTPPGRDDLQLAPTPAETNYRLNKIRLLHYPNPQREPKLRVPLLLVPSIINRYYVLDLQPGRSMVAYLLQQGFDLWLVDWGKPTAEDRFDTFDDYIQLYLHRLVNRVRQETGVAQISLLGYCIGGTFTAIYTALYPAGVASLINLAGPIDFSQGGILCTWTQPQRFRPEAITKAYGNMPGWLMNSAFDGLLPANQLRQALNLWDRLDHDSRLQDYLGLRHWLTDEVDFPGAAYQKYIGDCYQRNLLVKGQLTIDSRPVHLADITCPLLSITSDGDYIAPAGAVLALNQLSNSPDQSELKLQGGHIGIVTGRDARQKLWPALTNWLAPRSQ